MKAVMRKLGFAANNAYEIDMQNDFTFAIIRNPLDRFYSAYVQINRKKTEDTQSKIFFQEDNPQKRVLYFLDEISVDLYDEHIQLQSWFIEDFHINFLMTMDNLQKGFRKLKELKNIDIKLPMFNESDKIKLIEVISIVKELNLYDRINELYKRDWDLYREIKRGE